MRDVEKPRVREIAGNVAKIAIPSVMAIAIVSVLTGLPFSTPASLKREKINRQLLCTVFCKYPETGKYDVRCETDVEDMQAESRAAIKAWEERPEDQKGECETPTSYNTWLEQAD